MNSNDRSSQTLQSKTTNLFGYIFFIVLLTLAMPLVVFSGDSFNNAPDNEKLGGISFILLIYTLILGGIIYEFIQRKNEVTFSHSGIQYKTFRESRNLVWNELQLLKIKFKQSKKRRTTSGDAVDILFTTASALIDEASTKPDDRGGAIIEFKFQEKSKKIKLGGIRPSQLRPLIDQVNKIKEINPHDSKNLDKQDPVWLWKFY